MAKAGRPKKKAADRSTEVLVTLLKPDAMARLRATAAERNTTLAELVRHALRQTYLVAL